MTLTSFNSFSQQYNPMEYFPHSIGDSWEYVAYNSTQRFAIYKDSIDNEGNKYLFYEK